MSESTPEESDAQGRQVLQPQYARAIDSSDMLGFMATRMDADAYRTITDSDRLALLNATRDMGFYTTISSDDSNVFSPLGQKLIGVTTTSDRISPNNYYGRETLSRHFESKIAALEESLSGAKTAIEMLIEEYGKLSDKLDEREAEHAMLVSEVYKLKKDGEK